MMDSPAEETLFLCDKSAVRTLNEGRVDAGEYVAPIICRLLVDFSELGDPVRIDDVRSISARRCLTTER